MNNYQGYQNYQNQYVPNNQYTYQQNPYQQSYQMQNQYQNFQQSYQNDFLGGKIVDSIDVVRAINADLSGKANYYPKSDGSEIYCKRINPQTGASGIQTYVLKNDTEINSNNQEQQITALISNLKQDIFGQITELKNLVLESITAPDKGGTK